jgi:simple sugar transport system permease protein
MQLRLERRLSQPRWLTVAVPIGSLLAAFVIAGLVLLFTGHNPLATYRKLFNAAFVQEGSLTQTLVTTTPLIFTGLAAAAAFRMRLFNIGAEGQLYIGAICGAGTLISTGAINGKQWKNSSRDRRLSGHRRCSGQDLPGAWL